MIDPDHPADPPVITEASQPDELHDLLAALRRQPARLVERGPPLRRFLRQRQRGVLVAGICGHSHFGLLVTAQLRVAVTLRGQHLGRDLLLAGEHLAQQRDRHSA